MEAKRSSALAAAEGALLYDALRRRGDVLQGLQQEREQRQARERAEAESAAQRQPGESRQAWRYRTRHLRAAPLKR